jgi:hypothetical protein
MFPFGSARHSDSAGGPRRSIVNTSRWAPWLAVAIPIAVLFGPALLTDRSFAFRDASHFYYPLFEWCAREWGAGRVPLWNPCENAGIPALADTSSSLFYPGKLVFALPLDFALRYKLFIVGHVVLAALGSYWLARDWKCSRTAAAAAAIAYACGGNVVFQYCNVVFLIGAAWLPFAALATDRMLRQRSWSAALALGAVLALMILGGDPQMALNVLLAASLYVAILLFSRAGESQPEASVRPPSHARLLVSRVILLGLAAVVGFLLAAVQVLPSSEATKYSERAAFNRPRNIFEAARVLAAPADQPQPLDETRGQSVIRGLFGSPDEGSHHHLAYSFSVGPWRLAEYFWPNIGGRLFPTKRRWFALIPAEMKTWTPTLYLGLLPAMLAIASLRIWRGEPREKWLTWLAIFFTAASFGWYGIGWVIHEIHAAAGGDPAKLSIGPPVGGVYWLMVTLLPSYAYFRYPAKLLPLVSLGLALLAAFGWDRAFAERRPRLALALLVFGSITAVAAFVFWCGGSWLVLESRQGDSSLGPYDGIAAYRDTLAALVHAALVAFAARYCLLKAWRQPDKQPRWQFATLLLTAIEIAVANYWLAPTAHASLWRDQPMAAEAIHAAADKENTVEAITPPRVSRADLGRWRPPSFARQGSPDRLVEMAQWERDTLFPKHQLSADLGLLESYGSVKLMDYESLMFVAWQYGREQTGGQRLPPPTILRLLGAEYLVLPGTSQPSYATRIDLPLMSEPSWPEGATVWQMNRTLPRAWIVHEVEMLDPLAFPLRIADVDARTRDVIFPDRKPRDFSRQAVVETLEPLPAFESGQQPNNEPESCRITAYEPTHIVIEATLRQPGLVVLSDAWFPGWEATVHTRSTQGVEPQSQAAIIHRTNRVLRGVWLPAGGHTIEMHYRPASYIRGATISGASWVALAVVGLVHLTQRRKGGRGRREEIA